MKPIESTGHNPTIREREAAALKTVAERLDWCAMHLDCAGWRGLGDEVDAIAKRVAKLEHNRRRGRHKRGMN